MNNSRGGSMVRWWGVVVSGAAAALLFAWLGRVAGVSVATLVTIGAALAALMWMVVLVTLPWNLYFDARQVVAENAVSRERGIVVRPAQDLEAGRISRRMLWFALGGHIGTAAAAAAFAYVSGALTGYYLAGFYLLSTTVRPAGAYFAHLRGRITALQRESTHPRDDIATLTGTVTSLTEAAETMKQQLSEAQKTTAENLHRTQTDLAGDLAHLRQQTTTDLTRLENAQAADRATARNRAEELQGRIEQMARRIEATLDGISDHQELLTGMRALIRMIRTEAV
jgi:hypothetical protein